MLKFTGERIVPGADNCEPAFALKMYQEHVARYLFASQLCRGKEVLDVACGVGYGAQLLARQGAERVTAFDIDRDTICHAMEFYSHPRVAYFVASVDHLPFENDRFDVITCFEAIEHVEQPHRLLRCLARLLRPEGRLVMSTPRALDQRRSEFHNREFAPFEFVDSLKTFFPHVHLFVENNHFASLITQDLPNEINRVHALHPQFSLGQADYMIALAGHDPLDAEAIPPVLVLNDDRYVRNLERDVKILHEAEDRLKDQASDAARRFQDLECQLSAAGREAFEKNARLEAEVNARKDAGDLEKALRQELDQARLRVEALQQRLSEQATASALQKEQFETEQGRVTGLSEQLDAFRNQAAALEKELAAALQAAADAKTTSLKQESECSGLREELARRDQQIRELNSELASTVAEAARLRAQLDEESRRTSLLQEQLQRSEESLYKLRDQNQCMREAAETARQESALHQSRLDEVSQKFSRQEIRMENLKLSLNAANWKATANESELRATKDMSRRSIDRAVEHIVALRQEVYSWQNKCVEQSRNLSEVYRSLSWRIALPLRVLGGLLPGHSAWREPSVEVPGPAPVIVKFDEIDPEFNADNYLATYPDVAAAVQAGAIQSAYDHWIRHGRQEGRRSDILRAKPTSVKSRAEAVGSGLPYRAFYDVIYIIGCHEGESKRYRVHNLVESLSAAGYRAAAFTDADMGKLVDAEIQCAVLVLFRLPHSHVAARLLAYARRRGIQTVWDADDLIFEEDSVNYVRVVSTFSEDDFALYVSGVRRYRRLMLETNLVSVTTAFLGQRVERLGKRFCVIPNTLNVAQLQAAEKFILRRQISDVAVRIAYCSGTNTHQVDFQSCERALLKIMDRYPRCRFVLMGILDLGPQWNRFSDRIERIPFVPYLKMLETLATVDINLAPLEVDNPYCESKSQLKIFEAGLVETPTVASDTASYREAIIDGADGFLARTEQDWLHSLEKLVQSPELRRTMGRAARDRALADFGPSVGAAAAIRAYSLEQRSPQIKTERRSEVDSAAKRLKISWIVPGLIVGSGGHRNILRAAYYLRKFGHEIELYFTSTDLSASKLAEAVHKHFYPLDCPMHPYDGSIAPADVLFATHWSTVDAALRARHTVGEVMYFVQDFEPLFAPMGTEYILAENTYRQGLYCITSGPWCELLLRRDFGVEADHFQFPIDTSVYRPRPRTKSERNIIFFAKPEMPRRCYELGLMALKAVNRRRPDLELILFGSRNVDQKALSFPATVVSLLPTIEDLAKLYANADAGMVFSTTNPSLVPYEMLACGLPVIDLGREGNEVNYGGRRDIALLADPTPSVMAWQICDLLENQEEIARRSRNGIEFVRSFPSEEEMARRVEELILRRVKAAAVSTVAAG